MEQDLNGNQIKYLMIFIKDQPAEGLEAFQRKFVRIATYKSEGTLQPRTYHECIGKDTKTKILVTGMIRLNTRNILTGLKMAFPPLNFDTHTLNIQRFSLIGAIWTQEREAGVIVAAEQTGHMGEIRWQQPQVYDLQTSEAEAFKALIKDEATSDSFAEETHETLNFNWENDPFDDSPAGESLQDLLEEQLDQRISFDDMYEDLDDDILEDVLEVEKDVTSEGSVFDPQNDEVEFDIKKEAFEEIFNKDIPGITGFYKGIEEIDEVLDEQISEGQYEAGIRSVEFDDLEDEPTGIKRPDVIDAEMSGGLSRISGFDDESDFLKDDDEDEFSKGIYAEEYSSGISDWEKLKSSMYDNEEISTEATFIDDGQMVESPIDAFHESEVIFEEEGREVPTGIRAWILEKIEELPVQKISFTLIILGALVICSSFAIKAFQPDFEAMREAAGIMDVSEWIITNDLVGLDTNDWFPLWEASPEYYQYWSWYDTYWKPRSDRFNAFRAGLISLGAVASGFGIMTLLGIQFIRKWPLRSRAEPDNEGKPETKRISHDFITDSDIWPLIDAWTVEKGFKILEVAGTRRLYRKRGGFSHPPIMFFISSDEDEVHFEAWVSTWIPTLLIPLISDMGFDALEAREAILPESIQEAIDSLLRKFEQALVT
jgi:hypothetical protein